MTDVKTPPSSTVRRRQLLHWSVGLASLPLLAACGVAPTTPQPKIAAAAKLSTVLPTYVPSPNKPKPDFPATGDLYQDGYINYPANPVKALPAEPPGLGGPVNVFIAAYYPPPTPYDQNRAWQEINKQLNANAQMNIIPFAEYVPKLTTLMASGELPDVLHLVGGANAQVANLPQFLQAQCADLSPFLSGDAVKEYPNLAALPTSSWKNTGIFNGRIFALPVPRPWVGTGLFKVREIYDAEIGADYVPKNADDYKRILQQLNRPTENRWATASYAGVAFDIQIYAQVFGAPNQWRLEPSGRLVKDFETEEFKAAVGYVRDLVALGLFHPNSTTYNIISARTDFVGQRC